MVIMEGEYEHTNLGANYKPFKANNTFSLLILEFNHAESK